MGRLLDGRKVPSPPAASQKAQRSTFARKIPWFKGTITVLAALPSIILTGFLAYGDDVRTAEHRRLDDDRNDRVIEAHAVNRTTRLYQSFINDRGVEALLAPSLFIQSSSDSLDELIDTNKEILNPTTAELFTSYQVFNLALGRCIYGHRYNKLVPQPDSGPTDTMAVVVDREVLVSTIQDLTESSPAERDRPYGVWNWARNGFHFERQVGDAGEKELCDLETAEALFSQPMDQLFHTYRPIIYCSNLFSATQRAQLELMVLSFMAMQDIESVHEPLVLSQDRCPNLFKAEDETADGWDAARAFSRWRVQLLDVSAELRELVEAFAARLPRTPNEPSGGFKADISAQLVPSGRISLE